MSSVTEPVVSVRAVHRTYGRGRNAVHALQDQVQVSQPGGPGAFEVPRWDMASLEKLRAAFTVSEGEARPGPSVIETLR